MSFGASSVALSVVLGAIGFNPAWPPTDTELPAEAFLRLETMPDDPGYAPRNDPFRCGGQLEFLSATPACLTAINDDERNREVGVGAHVDRAWAWTIGRPDVTIAIASDGVDWSDPDLVTQWRLDAGELPAPMTSTVAAGPHDRNGDGRFNVQDYTTATASITPTIDRVVDRRLLARPDRGDTNGNGLLDPQDLIRIFSNGIDDDADGYIDDIAGWDHLDDDNDPGVSIGAPRHHRWIAAAANNGIGLAGVCPGCSVLPTRVGSRGRSQANVIGLAVLYAVDEGADVIGVFAAAIEATTFLGEAVDYAFQSGRLIVASAGKSSGRARPIAWNPDRVLIVGSVGFDAADNRTATSALVPDGCSGYGPQLAVVGPGQCNDLGPSIAVGTAALLFSAARGIPDRGVPALVPPLSASEALQILTTTTDDVLPTTPTDSPLAARPQLGWDERSGHGRINARRAVDAIVRRRVPPWAEITSPAWYTVADPTLRDTTIVTATIRNPRLERVAWTLTAAPGLEPAADAFVTVTSGQLEAGEVAAIEGEVVTTGLFPDTAARPDAYGQFAMTLRIVTRASFGGDVVSGEARRVFFVHRDLELLPAFPLRLASGVASGPRILDLDGDGDLEIVVATVDGMLHAIDRFGETIDTFEVRTSPSLRIRQHAKSPAFSSGAVSADVAQSIVAALSAAPAETDDDTVSMYIQTTEGAVLSARADGDVTTVSSATIAAGTTTPAGMTATPVLYDVDRDGTLDVVFVRPNLVEAQTKDGTSLPGWPVVIDGTGGTPSVGDVDGDGVPEVVVVTPRLLYVIEADGTLGADQPREIVPLTVRVDYGEVFRPSAALGDINGDGRLDIVFSIAGQPMQLLIDGTLIRAQSDRAFGDGSDLPERGPFLVAATNHVTLGSLVTELPPRAIVSVSGPGRFEGLLPGDIDEVAITAFDAAGVYRPGFPRRAMEAGMLDALIADIDGDRRAEIIWSEGADRLRATAFDGSRPRNYPKLTGDEVVGTPVVEDLDGDGFLDLVAVTRTGQLFVWRTRGPADGRVRWNGYHHDLRATGNLETEPFARTKVKTSGGCSCRSSRGTASAASGWLLLVALLGIFLRRQGGGLVLAPLRS